MHSKTGLPATRQAGPRAAPSPRRAEPLKDPFNQAQTEFTEHNMQGWIHTPITETEGKDAK